MLIRSQDKESMFTLEHNGGLWIHEPYEQFEIEAVGFGSIGSYSSKEKAIKVLDMIQAAYESSCYCDHAFDSAAQVQRPYIFVRNEVFQMPQDSEVEV
jgi:hypothetical protein